MNAFVVDEPDGLLHTGAAAAPAQAAGMRNGALLQGGRGRRVASVFCAPARADTHRVDVHICPAEPLETRR